MSDEQQAKPRPTPTGRDRQAVEEIAGMGGVPLDLLAGWLGSLDPDREGRAVSIDTMRQSRQRWQRLGWMNEHRILAGAGGVWVWPTAQGLREAGSTWRACREPSLTTLAHRRAVWAARLELAGRGWGWVPERELHRRQHADGRRAHVADGLAVTPDGEVPVEVELTRKSRERVVEIVGGHLAGPGKAIYFVTGGTRPVVEAALVQLGEPVAGRVWVRDLPDLATVPVPMSRAAS